MAYNVRAVDAQTGEITDTTYTDQEAIDLGLMKSPEQVASELEAEVQENADAIMQNGDRDLAMALATVDLVMAARDGQLAGLSRAQIRQAYRDRVVHYLRDKRGLLTGGA